MVQFCDDGVNSPSKDEVYNFICNYSVSDIESGDLFVFPMNYTVKPHGKQTILMPFIIGNQQNLITK